MNSTAIQQNEREDYLPQEEQQIINYLRTGKSRRTNISQITRTELHVLKAAEDLVKQWQIRKNQILRPRKLSAPSIRTISIQSGYSKGTVRTVIRRFSKLHWILFT